MTAVLQTWGQTLTRHVHLHRCRRHCLAQIRTAIKAKAAETAERTQADETPNRPCPKCRKGRLRVVGEIALSLCSESCER